MHQMTVLTSHPWDTSTDREVSDPQVPKALKEGDECSKRTWTHQLWSCFRLQNPESLDLSIQTALSALFPPFEVTAPIVISQLFRTIEERYHGDALQCLLDFLIPSKHVLESVQQAACVSIKLVFPAVSWARTSWTCTGWCSLCEIYFNQNDNSFFSNIEHKKQKQKTW